MHPNQPPQYGQPGVGRRRRRDPEDGIDNYPQADSAADATQLYQAVPVAATPQHTRVLPAMPQNDPGYPGAAATPPPPRNAPPSPATGNPYYANAPAAPATPARTYGRTSRRTALDLKVTLGNALTGGGGLLIFLFSFAPFVRYDNPQLLARIAKRDDLPEWFSAWSRETLLAPLSWWAVFAGLCLVGIVGLRLKGTPADREVAGFRLGQIEVMLSLFAGLILLGYALAAKSVVFGTGLLEADGLGKFLDVEMSFGWGGYFMTMGALAAVAGAFLDHRGVGPTVWPRPTAPQSYPAPQGYQSGAPQYGMPQPGHPPAGPAGPYQQGGYRL